MAIQAPALKPRELPRKLGLLDSINIVVGTMIGSAIFLVPTTIARNIHSVPLTLAMWLIAAIVSMFGALAFAELGAMMPSSGGQYVYLRESWGPLWGFLCGWSFFLVARSGATAAVAAGFATYLTQFVPMPVAASRGVAACLILMLTLVNYRGVRFGAGVQNVFTGLKLAGLLALIGSALFWGGPIHSPSFAAARDFSPSQFGAAMTACIFSYNGWLALGQLGGEIKEPQRNIPRAIILGVGVVTMVYILANIAYFRILTVSEVAGTERVAEAVATRTMGGIGSTLVGLTILASTLGATNSTLMTGSRVYFAQARDGLFFRLVRRICG